MPDQNHMKMKLNLKIFPHGIMMVLVLCVIFLSVMAFVNPAAQGATATPVPSGTISATDAGTVITQTTEEEGTEEPLAPPTPEEIGSTNGIILWSTLLVLILLVGTLRETILRKGR